MRSRSPYYFLHGNLCLRAADDAWAAYRLDGESYPGLSRKRKIELKERIEAFAYSSSPTSSSSAWRASGRPTSTSSARSRRSTLAAATPRSSGALLERHRQELASRGVVRPEVFLLRPARRAGARRRRRRAVGGALALALAERSGFATPAGSVAVSSTELRRAEERTFDRVYDYLPCERARSGEVARLIRTAYSRGLGELEVDPNWRPQALWVEGLERRSSGAALRALPARPPSPPRVARRGREAGASDRLRARHLAPGDARRRRAARRGDLPGRRRRASVRAAGARLPRRRDPSRRVGRQRSGAEARAEADGRRRPAGQGGGLGEHGASPQTEGRTQDARELQERLAGSDRPPLLRSAITLAVGAPTRRASRGARRAPARGVRPRRPPPPAGRAAPPVPRRDAGAAVPVPRLPGPPASRAVRGDGADGDRPRRLGDRPLRRLRAERLAGAGPVRPRRGGVDEPPADRAADRLAGLGQDDGARAAALPRLPAGLDADRRHRPEGRSPPRPPARGRRGDGDDRALARGALSRPARPDAGRRGGDPRGRDLELPAWRSCRRSRRPGRPRSAARWRLR